MNIEQLDINRLRLKKLGQLEYCDSFVTRFLKSKLCNLNIQTEKLLAPESILLFMLQRDMVVNKGQFQGNETIEEKLIYDQQRLQRNLQILVKIGPNYIDKNGFNELLIKAIHKHLTLNSLRKNGLDRPGRFRKQIAWIGLLNAPKEDASIVTLDAGLIPEYIDDIVGFVNNDLIDPLIRLALFYFQFIAVHPFGNGNGRTARVLIPLLSCHLSIMSSPLLWMASGLDASREKQFFAFREVFNKSSYNPWLEYFMITLEKTIDELTLICEKLLAVQADAIEILSILDLGATINDIIEAFFCRPVWDIAELESHLALPKTLFDEVIQKLIKSGWSSILPDGLLACPSLQEVIYSPSHLGVQGLMANAARMPATIPHS
jgi:fido (protein-threonine AMPylation protein)